MKDWKTTLTGIGAAGMYLCSILAVAPQDTRAQVIGSMLPEHYRIVALKVCLVAAGILHIANAFAQADAKRANPTASASK